MKDKAYEKEIDESDESEGDEEKETSIGEDVIEKLKETLGDSSEEAISIKEYLGFFKRIAPNKHNREALEKKLSAKLFGLHKKGYVYVVIISPNSIEQPYLIPYKYMVKLKDSIYNLDEGFRTVGDYGISTYYFNHSSSSPINMTKSTHEIDASKYDKLVKDAQLDAIVTGKLLKGSRQFPAFSMFMLIVIMLIIFVGYNWYTTGGFTFGGGQ